ncbi:MAG: hypothetical protein M1414_04020 [Candidatus Thermoplasmatota archaeon]|jgi:hypothetical protein|nr:hypothetical protein [Candidatus Thermoplasmatota archaeon]
MEVKAVGSYMYVDKINMRSPLNYNTLEFIRKKEYEEQKNISKLKRENKRGKRLKAYVVLTISLLFGFYAVMGVSVIASEYNIATSYFESNNMQMQNENFAYYYFAWWSPTHGNAINSMIDALYATGLGWLISWFANQVGHPGTGGSAVAFVAAILVGVYFGASALVALSQASAATGFVITASGAVISAILPILLTYLAALGSA